MVFSKARSVAPPIILSALMLSSDALAQLEEVIVTAQKRAEDMQDVPIAVTAMNEQMLKDAGITNVTGVAVRTPGFSMGEFNPTQPQLYIRGIGSNGDGAASGEQSVAMFIDGVYVNRSAGTGLELFDLASIEVLRGPQGTLWGKNSIAGAINVTTKKPSPEFESGIELSAGNLGYRNIRGMITGGLTDKVNGKLSLNKKHRDSYVKSVYNDDVEHGELDSMGARAQLDYLFSDSLSALFTLNYSHDERTATASSPGEEAGSIAEMLDRAQADGLPVAGFHENYSDTIGFSETQNFGGSLKLEWDIGELTLTSISAYTSNEADLYSDGFNIAADIWAEYGFFEVSEGVEVPLGAFEVYSFIDEESTLATQEFRLAGFTESLKWQTGLYYAQEDILRNEGGYYDAPLLLAVSLGPDRAALYNPATDEAIQDNTTTSYALFGEMTYSLSERLELTFGARYTLETKDYTNTSRLTSYSEASNTPVIGNELAPQETSTYHVEETWSAPTFRFVANYFFGDDSMVYGSVATGFKSGGFAPSSTFGIDQQEPFNEEKALNYEIGLKSTLFDQTLRVNTAVFRTEYADLQVLQQFPCDSCIVPPLITKNAGEAISQGLELEATYLLTDSLTLSGSYAYLDTEYTELGGQLAKDEGNALRNAPKNAYTFAVSHETTVGELGFLNSRLEYIHKEKAYQDTSNFDYAAIDEYRLFNGRMAFTSATERWEFALWGKNLTNEEYYLHNFQIPPFGAIHVPATPRTYGLTVTYTTY